MSKTMTPARRKAEELVERFKRYSWGDVLIPDPIERDQTYTDNAINCGTKYKPN